MVWWLQGPESHITVDLGCWHFPISGPDTAAVGHLAGDGVAVAVDNPEPLIFAGVLAVAAALVTWGAHQRSVWVGAPRHSPCRSPPCRSSGRR
jgi:hypothetical protein